MAELWTYLIGHGPLDGIQCAGSRTPIAFEERAFLSRLAAKQEKPSTARTVYNENEGLLHLRVARPDQILIDILFADYSGERYRLVRDGATVEGELPFVARADRILLVVNGAALGDASARELETNHSKRLLLKIRDSGLVGTEQVRVAVVVARADQADEAAWEAAKARLHGLMELARELDSEAVMFKVAARPADGSEAWGLGELMTWICAHEPAVSSGVIELAESPRSIGRLEIPR